MLIPLMNLPRKIQLAIAAAVAVLFAMVPVCLALISLMLLREQSSQIVELRDQAGRVSVLAIMKEQALKIAATPVGQAGSELLIDAENLPIAKANLQSRISAIAAAHNASVSSSGSVPDMTENGLLLIGLRADISGTNEAIEGVLSAIEVSKPLLLVREFLLRSEGAPPIESAPTLTASIRLYGVTRALDEASPAREAAAEPASGQP